MLERDLRVSIPRSEFWSFGHKRSSDDLYLRRGFNSSVGILVVRTGVVDGFATRYFQFQFLGRNSGRSDGRTTPGTSTESATFQFLGRNSGRSDVFHREVAAVISSSFNSSVGILVVRTTSFETVYVALDPVSIPRSEFWSFGRRRW